MILYSDSEPDYFLYAELRRDMACSRAAFARLMRIMLAVSLSIGLVFFMVGAWPVIGFLGLDVLLIWGAFRLYECSHQKQFDRVMLDKNGLLVQQYQGEYMQQTFYEPSFIAVHTDSENNSDFVHVCQRGNCSAIGRWLGIKERQSFARMLKRALKERQAALVKRA